MNKTVTFIGATAIIIGGAYSLWLFNWIAFGNLKTQYLNTFSDLNFREFLIFIPLIINIILVGLYPEIFLSLLHSAVSNLIEQLYF